jgi:hypothetical protein
MGGCRETELQMATRHVREGEERIARQLDIIAKLEMRKHHEAVALARKVLQTMHLTLDMAKRHAQEIENRSKH